MAAVDGHPVAIGITAGNAWLLTANEIGFEQEPERAFRLFSCRHEPPANRGSQGTASPALSTLPAGDQLIRFVRKRLHVGLGGRIGHGPDQMFSQLSTLNSQPVW
jgi:hypothetical protein